MNINFKITLAIILLLYPVASFSTNANGLNSNNLSNNGRRGIAIREVKALEIPKFMVPASGLKVFELTSSGDLGARTSLNIINHQFSRGEYSAKVRKGANISIQVEVLNLPTGFKIKDFPLMVNGTAYNGSFIHNFVANSNYLKIYLGILMGVDSAYSPERQDLKYKVTIKYN